MRLAVVVDIEVGHRGEQLLQGDLYLQLRQVRPDTAVRADAEAGVPVRLAIDTRNLPSDFGDTMSLTSAVDQAAGYMAEGLRPAEIERGTLGRLLSW